MKKIILPLLILLTPTVSFSQIVKHINLAEGPTKISEPVEAGKEIIIKILNRSKINTYEIIINRTSPDIPPLESDGINRVAVAAPTNCDNLGATYNNILAETTEAKLPPLRKELLDLISKTDASCSIRLKAIQLNQELDVSYTIQPLKKGEILEITVKRISSPAKEWLASYTTGSKGVWKTSYGFAFIPNWFSKDEKYYLNSTNVITRETDLKNLDYAPAIFFNWFPSSQALNDFSWGLSGGLGVNFNVEPAIFLGGSATYNHNISVNFGMVAYRQSFLKGRYNAGDIIAENNFDEETGLHQKLFRVNPFIAISFRFGKNPFTTSDD
jgi:hypothetical protein